MKRIEFLSKNNTYCLRGIAITMIILSHCYNGYPTSSPQHFFPHWIDLMRMDLWGGAGAGIFLFLSGYGMFFSLSEREGRIGKGYVAAKLRRLLEPFLIYWLVEIITLFIFAKAELTPHIFYEIITFSIHPDVENWFFKVIMGVYVISIFLFTIKLSHRTRIIILFGISLIYLLVMRHSGFGLWWYDNILCFPLGMLFGYRKAWFERLSPIIMMIISVFVMSVCLFIHFNSIIFHLFVVLFAIYALMYVPLSNRLLYYCGYNSIVLYFMECPIEDKIMMFSYTNFPVYCILSVLGTLLLSWVCITPCGCTSSSGRRWVRHRRGRD